MKIRLTRQSWILLAIIFIASLLRLFKLDVNPPALTPDEAALGYNAYSILKTGKDEFGKVFPIIFKSFGDYKPGLYIYTSIPFVFLFGLSEFSTRFASALAGIVAVLLIYLIAKKLLPDKKYLPEISAFLLAISPWHIHFSRGAWEVNLALTLTLAGVYYFLKSFQKQSNLIYSAVFFGLTLISYQGAKLSSGVILLILTLLYFKKLLSFKKSVLAIALIIGFIISLPVNKTLFTQESGRLKVFSIFSYPRPKEYLQIFLDQGNEKIGDVNYFIFHSETQNFVRGIFGRYFNYYSAKFLFFQGDWQNPRHSAPNHGVFTVADIVLFVIGILALVKEKFKRETALIWLWLLLAPIPAVLSRDQIHAVRSLNLVIPVVLVNSFGLLYFLNSFKTDVWKKAFVIVFGGVYLVSYAYFLDAYFIHMPKHNSIHWDYGYKQIVETVTPIQNDYKMVRVQQSYAQPYIFFLFYQKYDPAKYQSQNNWIPSEVSNDVGKVEHLDNIYFGPVDWSVNRGDRDTLFVADTVRIPVVDSSDENQFREINEIKYLDGIYTAFRILEVK